MNIKVRHEVLNLRALVNRTSPRMKMEYVLQSRWEVVIGVPDIVSIPCPTCLCQLTPIRQRNV